jgi:hypothetical protein
MSYSELYKKQQGKLRNRKLARVKKAAQKSSPFDPLDDAAKRNAVALYLKTQPEDNFTDTTGEQPFAYKADAAQHQIR